MEKLALIENRLAMAERNVEAAQQRVELQRIVIADLEMEGCSTEKARGILAGFEETLALHTADRDRLVKEKSQALDAEAVAIDKLGFRRIEPGYWRHEFYDVCIVQIGIGRSFAACLSPTPDMAFCLVDEEGYRLHFEKARLACRAAIYARQKSAH